MNRLIIRHFIPAADSGVRCVPCEETSGYLQSMMESLAPKLANLDIQLVLQSLEIHEITEANCGKLNYVSFFAPELGLEIERPIEEVLNAGVSFEPCDHCSLADGTPFEMRTLKTEGSSFGALPPGILSDALIRVVFSTMDSCGKGGCASCAGCGEH